MRRNFEPEKNNFTKDLPGISKKMLDEHFKLYEGYVKKTNEIQQKIQEADKSEANGVFSYIGELKRQETFAVNGMKLHEVYFAHLGGDGQPRGDAGASGARAPSTDLDLVKMIEKDFGSLENWKLDMVATGIAARGWAVLAFDFKDDQLHNYGSDAHNVGAVWGCVPLIVLDVYEHAYFMDYGVNRKDYIDSFFKNLDWNFANDLVVKYGLSRIHHKN